MTHQHSSGDIMTVDLPCPLAFLITLQHSQNFQNINSYCIFFCNSTENLLYKEALMKSLGTDLGGANLAYYLYGYDKADMELSNEDKEQATKILIQACCSQ